MTINTPAGRLRLGADLNAPFPPSLAHLSNPDLLTLLARLDPTPDNPLGTGALDWADLTQRLHYILDLFRCFQETPELHQPPFTPEQLAELQAGRRPSGRL